MHDFDIANPNGPFSCRFPFRRLSCEKPINWMVQGGDVRLRALHRQDLRSTDRKARTILQIGKSAPLLKHERFVLKPVELTGKED